MAKDMSRVTVVSLLAAAMLLSQSLAVYADDGDKGNSDTVIDIDVSGDVKVDISASGPSDLNVEAKGPAQVSIDAGDQVDLDVEASDESEVLIDGEEFDQPAGYQGSGENDPPGDLHNESLNLEEMRMSG